MSPPFKVLVVDDSATVRELVRRALQAAGHEVYLAETADAGLTEARRVRPDVILLDLVLPDADGLLLLQEIRRAGVDAAVVALTGATNPEVAYRFLRAGAADFLSKKDLVGGTVAAAVARAAIARSFGIGLSPPQQDEEESAPQSLIDDPPVEQVPPSRALDVLVIDDTDVARAAVRGVLGRQGWIVHEAEDLRDALRALDKLTPDVVLLDHLLPDADGVEALARLRAAGLRAPVIGISGHGSEAIASRFLWAGAIDFLPKDDLSEARLVHAVRRAAVLAEGLSLAGPR